MLATAMHMPGAGPSIGRAWIKANAIAAAVFAATGLLVIVGDRILSIGDPVTDPLVRAIAAAVYFVATLAGLVAYATLIGGALNRKLPAFPWLGWSALHIGFGVALGALAAATVLLNNVPAGEVVPTAMPKSKAVMALIVFTGIAVGSVMGAVVGGLQAVVLRKAARGVGAWIGWSTVAGVVLALSFLAVAFYMAHAAPGRGLTQDLVFEAIAFFGTMIGAVVMLPAVSRLRAR